MPPVRKFWLPFRLVGPNLTKVVPVPFHLTLLLFCAALGRFSNFSDPGRNGCGALLFLSLRHKTLPCVGCHVSGYLYGWGAIAVKLTRSPTEPVVVRTVGVG